MRELIINKPELQTLSQKIGSKFVAVLSWLLWVYFLFPLFTLGGWLLGLKNLSDEIRWFGGYKTLLELLQMYGLIILGIGLFWLCWTTLLSLRKERKIPEEKVHVSDAQLCERFAIAVSQLQQGRQAKVVTVSFDQAGHIIGIADETG